MSKNLKPLGEKKKTGLWVGLVTAVFLAAGITLTVIAYKDTLIQWMATTGIALIVVASFPLLILAYNLINKKIDS